METLKERISREYIEAFKAKETVKKNLLGVIKAEITTLEKNTSVEQLSDVEVSKILTKVSKNLKETIASSDNEEAKAELAIVEAYLPKQMSEDEVRAELETVIAETGVTGPAAIGKVMGGFNAKFAGKADGKMVSTIAKELLNKA